jgi:hypothetical protein
MVGISIGLPLAAACRTAAVWLPVMLTAWPGRVALDGLVLHVFCRVRVAAWPGALLAG